MNCRHLLNIVVFEIDPEGDSFSPVFSNFLSAADM